MSTHLRLSIPAGTLKTEMSQTEKNNNELNWNNSSTTETEVAESHKCPFLLGAKVYPSNDAHKERLE